MGSIIKKIRDKKAPDNEHIARITGRRTAPAPIYYRNIETGRDYWHITGAIGWPGGGKPGFGIIVGVEKTDDREPAIYVLAETECQDVGELICRCVGLGKKYGRGICPGIDLWWGDAMRFSSFVSDYNLGKEHIDKINIANPIGFERPNRFEIYAQRIRESLGQEKRLFLGGCKKLRAYIQNLPPDASEADSPAVFCLGGVMHTLMALRPWMVGVRAPATYPTRMGEIQEYREYRENRDWLYPL